MAERELEITMKAKDQITATARKISKSVSTMGSGMKKAFDAAAKAASVAKSVIQKFIGPLLKIGSIASAITGGAFGLMITQAANLGDQMSKLSQRFGVATETLSTLRYQAERSGTDFETLVDTFKDLGKNIFEASRDSGVALDTFNELGIAVKDASGKARATNDVFLDVAEVFSKMEDGNKKATQAMLIFGEAGQRIIPLLNSGKEGLKGMADEAARLGLVIDKEAAEKAANFNDKLSLLKGSLTGLKFAIGVEFFDDLAETFKKLGFWIADNREKIISFIREVKEAASTIVNAIVGSFSNETIATALGNFTENVFVAMFKTVGDAAGTSFGNAFVRQYNKLIDKLSFDWPHPLGGSFKWNPIPKADLFETDESTSFLDTLSNELAELRAVMEQEKPKIEEKAMEIREAISKGLGGGTDAGGELGPWSNFASGFQLAAEQIKQQFEDLSVIGGRFAGDLHRALSDTFFSAMNQELNSLEDAFKSTFEAIVQSIKSILADLMSSQIVGLFSKFLGGGALDGLAGGGIGSSGNKAGIGAGAGFDFGGGSVGPLNGIDYGSSGSNAAPTLSGNTGSSGGITVNINAVDAQSVAGLLKNNGKAIADALSSALSSDNARRRQLGASLS